MQFTFQRKLKCENFDGQKFDVYSIALILIQMRTGEILSRNSDEQSSKVFQNLNLNDQKSIDRFWQVLESKNDFSTNFKDLII